MKTIRNEVITPTAPRHIDPKKGSWRATLASATSGEVSHVDTVFSAEVAFWLRIRLGSICAWDSLLADMRRGRASLQGHVLLPHGRVRAGGSVRPFYLTSDVQDFVAKVAATGTPLLSELTLQTQRLEINKADPHHWTQRRLHKTSNSTTFATSHAYKELS
jgi:hypothetical protein